jgi:predicted dehydrogenase
MAQTPEQAAELVAIAEDRGLILMVGHLLLYHPAFRFVEEAIQRGDLGDVYYLYSTRVNLGIIRRQENALEATLYFAGGRIAHLHTSWLDPHKLRQVTVVGSRKMAVIDDTEPVEKVRLYDKGVDLQPGEERYVDYAQGMRLRSGDIVIPKIEMREPLRLECEHFVECVRTGKRPRTHGASGLAVVRVLEAARRSLAERGAAVELAAAVS